MKKKLLALVLILTMSVAMITACGKKTSDLGSWDTLREIGKIQTGKFSVELNISAKGLDNSGNEYSAIADEIFSNLTVKVDGSVESADSQKGQFNISYKYGDQKEYTKVTDLIVDKDAVYINMKALSDMIATLDSEYAMFSGFLLTDQDYVKITLDEIKSFAESYGVAAQIPDVTQPANAKETNEAFVDTIIAFLEKTVDGVKPAVLTEKDGKHSFHVTEKNIKPYLENLKAVIEKDGEKLINDLMEKIKKLGDNETLVTSLETIKKSIPDAVKGIDSTITELDADATTTFDFGFDYSLEGKEGKRKADISMNFNAESKEDSATIEMTVKEVFEEGKADAVKVPEASTSFTDYMTNILSILGQ